MWHQDNKVLQIIKSSIILVYPTVLLHLQNYKTSGGFEKSKFRPELFLYVNKKTLRNFWGVFWKKLRSENIFLEYFVIKVYKTVAT